GLFVTFVTKMPGYYLSWGRYTLLIGVMILPVAMAEVECLRRKPVEWWRLSGMFLLTVGTLLSHYFTAFLLALFFGFLALQGTVEIIRYRSFQRKPFFSIATSIFMGLVFASRWYYRIFVYSDATSRPVLRMVDPETLEGSWDYLFSLVGPTSGYVLIALGIIGLLWSVFTTKKYYYFGWALLTLVLSLPTGFRLMNFRYDYYALISFIPITISAAFAIVLSFERLLNEKRISTGLILLLGASLTVFGASQNLRAINQETVLVTKTDLVALQWIEIHTPREARFFINTVGWSPNNYRGVDGGGWILPITSRWTIVPTIFYPMSADEDFILNTMEMGARASSITYCDDEFWSLLKDAEINYLYIKEGIGSLQPESLTSCEGVHQLTQLEDIHIYLIIDTGNTP
ncbi:MAG: hypothetical protein WCY93_10410, partial [Anaerolineaceae bacterium]